MKVAFTNFVVLAGALFIAQLSPMDAANAGSPITEILSQEQRWTAASATGDASALGKILGPSFIHTNYRGAVFSRAQTLSHVSHPSPYDEVTSDHQVQLLGNVAVVHGINTIRRQSKIVMQLRYTDVYVRSNGHWAAVSAQETPIR